MRILYLLTSLGMGGAEKQVVTLAERMAARGHTVAFLVLKHTEEEWPVKLPVLRLNMRKTPMGILRGLRFAKGFLALFRADVIHGHTFPANLFSRLLRLVEKSGATRPAIVNTIHNVYEGGWHRMLLYRLTDPWADSITAVSGAAAQRFVRLWAVPARKMSVLTNGIDTEAFAPDRKRRRQVRGQTGCLATFVWIAVGRLVPAKDYPNLLRAFAEVCGSFPATELWIVGEGDTIGLEKDLEAFGLGESNKSNNSSVRVLGLRRDVAGLLDAADGFVLSSAWEGMPLALGEAMAMEKVAVATDVGGVRELVGGDGVVVPARDSGALAEGMLAVMRMDSGDRRFKGRAARSRIEAHFSMDAKADAWERLYSQVTSEKSA